MPEEREQHEQKGNMIRLGGLWQNKSRGSGEMFLSGTFTPGVAVFVFKNKHKTEEKHPDYVLCIAPKEKRDKDEAGDGGGFMS